jgi:hypothetical protein
MNVSDNVPNPLDDRTGQSLSWGSSIFWNTVGPALLLLVGVAAVIGIAKLLPLFLKENSTLVLRSVLAAAAVGL